LRSLLVGLFSGFCSPSLFPLRRSALLPASCRRRGAHPARFSRARGLAPFPTAVVRSPTGRPIQGALGSRIAARDREIETPARRARFGAAVAVAAGDFDA